MHCCITLLKQRISSPAAPDSGVLGGSRSGVRGRDVHLVLGLMLSEAAQGADKVLSYEAMALCKDCQVG